MKTIIVLAFACRNSGALNIYNQFINWLNKLHGKYKWYIWIDSSMPQPLIENVSYIIEDNHSFLHRIFFNKSGLTKWLNDNSIKANCIVSLQNTGIETHLPQIIYYHQSLPFYKDSWNFFKRTERHLWLYKNLYPYFVNKTLNKKTEIVVQIPFIKEGFKKRFNFPSDNIHILFPDVSIPPISTKITHERDGFSHFLYPATPHSYKQHITIIKALSVLLDKEPNIYKNLKIHFTIKEKDLNNLIPQKLFIKIRDSIIFEGYISQSKLGEMYQTYKGLLFPSRIETLGLPLVEAANFGMPILANDLPYAHDVLRSYEGCKYINHEDIESWASAIKELSIDNKRYTSFTHNLSSWPRFFQLIENNSNN